MNGRSGSGCGCCSCGCLGCLAPLIAIIIVIMVVFAIFGPMNHNYEYKCPDSFDEFYPDFNDGTSLPSGEGAALPAYELSEAGTITYAAF